MQIFLLSCGRLHPISYHYVAADQLRIVHAWNNQVAVLFRHNYSFVYIFPRWHLFRHLGYLRYQQQVDLLTLKLVSETCVTWATSVPILVFLGLSVLELGPLYVTDRRQTKASLNASAIWVGGIIMSTCITDIRTRICFALK